MRVTLPILLALLGCKGSSTPPATSDSPPGTDTDLPVCTDAGEPNDTIDDPAPMGMSVAARLAAGNDDFWTVQVPPGMRAQITVAVTDDIDAELLRPTGAVEDSSSNTGGEDETLGTYSLLDVPQSFVVRTFAAAGTAADACIDYGLSATFACEDDGDVPDERGDAQNMAVGDEERGQVLGADKDWYAIDVSPGQQDRFLITFPPSAGSVDWEVWLDDIPDHLLQDGTADDSFPLVLDNADSVTLTFLVGLKHSTDGCNLYDLVVQD